MAAEDILHKLDHPIVNAGIFFPRPAFGVPLPEGSEDLDIEVERGVRISVRFHPLDATAPTILHFHGNGEVGADYDDMVPLFHSTGASLMCADFRGYGRSDGLPSVRALIEDAHPLLDGVKDFLKERGHTGPLVVMGRSLGSGPAIELAARRGDMLAGLIIESGFAQAVPLLELLGVPIEELGLRGVKGQDNEDKMAEVDIPVLILHAERDYIIQPWNADRNFEQAASLQKKLVMIPGADHNTVMLFGGRLYWDSIASFIGSLG